MKIPSKENFMKYLKNEDYKDWTGSGFPSTIYQYAKAIEKVMKLECVDTYLDLTDHIQAIINKYGENGEKKAIGEEGHSTVINALKRYSEYLLNECDWVPITGIWYQK